MSMIGGFDVLIKETKQPKIMEGSAGFPTHNCICFFKKKKKLLNSASGMCFLSTCAETQGVGF